ncbi:Imm6 family immunity protein [Priestia koreensis]|uniref:Imm6 family immunity protein n=1 Tax=Priestia koreensis TaxID=284581 RepID=UPI0034595A78
MENIAINNLPKEVKVGFVLAVAERIFSVIRKDDERYSDGREALDRCWLWVESHAVTGDELYELIDRADFTGISEFAEEELDLNVARVWSLLVDVVAYTSWEAYKNENVKYLPQSLESISINSISIFLHSAVETSFITVKEIEQMEAVMTNYRSKNTEIPTRREDFINIF